MKTISPALAKRALSFALALVLLLSLCPTIPLTADAAEFTSGWVNGSADTKQNLKGYFVTSHSNLIFTDNEPYDWKFELYQTLNDVSFIARTKIYHESDPNTPLIEKDINASSQNGVRGTVISYADFPELPTDLAGTFTLKCQLWYKSGTSIRDYGTMTQPFTRVINDNVTFEHFSHSKEDLVFTYADPIDIQLNIVQTSGVAKQLTATATITNASGATVSSKAGYALPLYTDIDVSLKDMVEVTNITTAGQYTVDIVLENTDGKEFTHNFSFTVVSMAKPVTATISGNNLIVDAEHDLTVKLTQEGSSNETFTADVTITDSTGANVHEVTHSNLSGNSSFTPDLSTFTGTGAFTMNVVVKDSTGSQIATTSYDFTRISTEDLSIGLVQGMTHTDENPTGNIFDQDGEPLTLIISNSSNAEYQLQVKCAGKYNGQESTEMTLVTVPANNAITLHSADFLKYGVYNTTAIEIYDATGTKLLKSKAAVYTFSRVLSTANPGDTPLLNINDHFTSNKGNNPAKIALAAQTGTQMWRASIPWISVENTNNKANSEYGSKCFAMPSSAKHTMDATVDNKMQALVILAYGNDGMYGTPYINLDYPINDATNNAWLKAYADYCYYVADMMARYYSDQVIGFEIWNEWNHSTMSKVPDGYRTGAHYAAVVKVASEQIEKVNTNWSTNFMVIAGATAGDGYSVSAGEDTESAKFISAFLSVDGIMDYIDGFSFHTYPYVEQGTSSGDDVRDFAFISPSEFLVSDRFKSVITRLAGQNKEIWVTETGWATNAVQERYEEEDGDIQTMLGATEEEQAAYMVQMYSQTLAKQPEITRIFWYDFMNDCDEDTLDWSNAKHGNNWGLIHSWTNTGNDPLAYSAKPGYVAMCAMSSMLGGATNWGTVDLGDGVAAYSFTKNGQIMVVAWTIGGIKAADKVTKTLNCSSGMTVTDMYGNTTGNLQTVELTECPIYIVCDPANLTVN